MKKLVSLLSALLVLSILTPSPVCAERPSSLEYQLRSLFSILYRTVVPYAGVVIPVEETEPIINGGSWGTRLGGDADDYGNGRGGGEGIIIGSDAKSTRLYGDDAFGAATESRDRGMLY